MKVITIDCDFVLPEYTASYLIVAGGEAVFIENNTYYSIPKLLAALREEGMSQADVRYAIITHVHLDHAGGTSRLLEICQNAVCIAHPKAARHVINPQKLIKSAEGVYGEELFKELFGQINPVAADRVFTREDGEVLNWQGAVFTFWHTLGHAKHHFCIHTDFDNSVYTGDTFGLACPLLQDEGPFIIPTTSPTDFDPPEAIKSVQRIAGASPDSVRPTHFGAHTTVDEFAEQLIDGIQRAEKIMEQAIDLGDVDYEARTTFCTEEVRNYIKDRDKQRMTPFNDDQWNMLDNDIKLNGAGIAWTAHRLHKKNSKAAK